jgi:1-deoxy-D-xylulose-5-phosphate synthase
MENILETISDPADIRKLNEKELKQLSEEIRKKIIDTVSNIGGHLSSNLGVVELTLALHRIFDTPKDKILWDVGHQVYPHKLITGRKEDFDTIRQYKGISGFPNREESEYDVLNTGHASTALSASLGMATVRDYNKEKNHIIAVVGDGALTGGIALEALNQIGHHKKRLIIVLNDNKMSISPNVGAISKYLEYLTAGQFYVKTKERVRRVVRKIPFVGDKIVDLVHKIADRLKKSMVPGYFFEELGIRYLGPINGHNIKELEEAFDKAKRCERPIIVHVVTEKGKGYKPAEKEANWFHSSAPFDIKTGKFKKKNGAPSYSSVFSDTVVDIAKNNKNIFAITAAMPEGTGLIKFQQAFPERYFDVGIAEQHGIEFAVGLALSGAKPIIALYSTFLQRAYDQIIHDVSLMDIPILIGIDRAGAVSGDGPTHQGIYDIAYLNPVPNFILMAPKDEGELRDMIYTAIQTNHPVAIRYPRAQGEGIPLRERYNKLDIGKWEIIKDGKDGIILAVGNRVYPAIYASKELEKSGISVGVINARFIKPLDEELLLNIAKEYEWIITVEDGVLKGGFGSAVSLFYGKNSIFGIKIHSLGYPEEILPQGDTKTIHALYGVDEEGIKKEVMKIFSGKGEKISVQTKSQ